MHHWILLLGDFKVNVCCHSKQLASEFLNIIDYFNLVYKTYTFSRSHFGLNIVFFL